MEAFRLGASVLAGDVDPVAVAITRFELGAALVPDLTGVLAELKASVGSRVATYHRTADAAGNELTVLHHFWVQVVKCAACGHEFDAHPHHQLAFEAEGHLQWVFCSACSEVSERPRDAARFRCRECDTMTTIRIGAVSLGRATCPQCRHSERLIDVGRRTARPPRWRLFALEAAESVDIPGSVPLAQRRFLPTRPVDIDSHRRAALAWQAHTASPDSLAPASPIHAANRTDARLIDYGYRNYQELFNPRQLLHLSLLAGEILKLPERYRAPLAIAFSNHLTTNCMLTSYAFGWRRLSPLFSVRAFRHVPRPVEINPWADGTGRGTFPNAVRRVIAASSFARAPVEPVLEGGFRGTVSQAPRARPIIQQAPASRLRHIADASIDIVLTDPPYFDNIAYSELSAFFRPWLVTLGLLSQAKGEAYIGRYELRASRASPESTEFQRRLGACFREIARVLHPCGRLIFTFQHSTAGAWHALACALASAPLRPRRVFPILGNGDVGLQSYLGSATWDAVFVFQRRPERNLPELLMDDRLRRRVHRYVEKLTQQIATGRTDRFRTPDLQNLCRAAHVAASLGLFGRSGAAGYPLLQALEKPLAGAPETPSSSRKRAADAAA